MEFRERAVVVTGGAGALGTALVERLIAAGAECHIPCLTAEEAERFPLRNEPRVRLIHPCDLADEQSVAQVFARVPAPWASIHLAGGFASAPLVETTKDDLMRQLGMNFVTAFLCCRSAVAAMRRSGGGRIVNVAARPALEWRSGAGMAAYAASKAAVAAMTVALAEEVAKDGILVNAVVPSIMDTAANRAAMPKADFGKWPKVEEVAQTILFLASPDNRVTRGALVPVYGAS